MRVRTGKQREAERSVGLVEPGNQMDRKDIVDLVISEIGMTVMRARTRKQSDWCNSHDADTRESGETCGIVRTAQTNGPV